MQDAYADSFTSALSRFGRADKGRDSRDAGDGDIEGRVGVRVLCDHIDVNNVLHVAAHHTKTEKAFFMKLFALLDLNMRRTKPQYTVTLRLTDRRQSRKPSRSVAAAGLSSGERCRCPRSSAIAQDRPDPRVNIVAEDRPRARVLRGDPASEPQLSSRGLL